jgi:hypothetical protein
MMTGGSLTEDPSAADIAAAAVPEPEEDCGVKGQMDLTKFLEKPGCECLNESDDHPFADCLTSGGGFLESDCDEQGGNSPIVA